MDLQSTNVDDDTSAGKDFFPSDFTPGNNHVIIGRGKKCSLHIGNARLRRIVASKLEEYSAAATKHDKSNIILSIVHEIRMYSQEGGFVKQDPDVGLWFDVGNVLAREKVSQTFRDALHHYYRSSNEFKKKRRREKQAEGEPNNQLPVQSQAMWRRQSLFGNNEIEQTNEEMVHMLSVLGLDYSNERVKPNDFISRLCSSLPDSSSLAHWLEEENGPSETTLFSETKQTYDDVLRPLLSVEVSTSPKMGNSNGFKVEQMPEKSISSKDNIGDTKSFSSLPPSNGCTAKMA